MLREIDRLEAELLRVGAAFPAHGADQQTAAPKTRAAATACLTSDV